jgi:hypothetical protein
MKRFPKEKEERRFSEKTGKLHIHCPHREETGIALHVVIREGCCYRSKECLVLKCRYNASHSDVSTVLSLIW